MTEPLQLTQVSRPCRRRIDRCICNDLTSPAHQTHCLHQAFRNFESNSPWEQVGEGEVRRPKNLTLTPPKPKEEPKK